MSGRYSSGLSFIQCSVDAFFYSECLCVCASPGARNASGQTGNISLIWSFVLLNAAHLSQQRKAWRAANVNLRPSPETIPLSVRLKNSPTARHYIVLNLYFPAAHFADAFRYGTKGMFHISLRLYGPASS